MTNAKMVICPYCGETQPAGERCRTCRGLFEQLSRQATHNAMGPWFMRDPGRPFHPGCSYETIVKMIDREQINRYTILRGPTTKQFWTVARRVPGIAHLLGYCHHCDAEVDAEDHGCHACGVSFGAYLDRNFLGLPEVQPLPWEAPVDDDLAHEEARVSAFAYAGAGSGGGLSSFASDEELRSGLPAGGVSSRLAGAPTSPHHVAAMPAPATSDPGLTLRAEPGQPEYASRTTLLSLQRRLEAQGRTIRLLAVLLLIAVIGGLVVSIVAVANAQTARRNGPPAPAPAKSVARPDQPAALVEPPVSTEAAGARTGEPGDVTPTTAPPPTAPPPTEPIPVATEDPAPPSEYQRALALAEAAADSGRARADRLADYEQALVLLRGIDAEQAPEGLATLIEELDRRRERLELEAFFPEGSSPPGP